MGVADAVKEAVYGLKFTIPKTVDILDWRLAATQRTLQLVVFVLFVAFSFMSGVLYHSEVPSGKVGSYVSVTQDELSDAQSDDADYCDPDKSPTFTWSGCKDQPFWCDDDVKCLAANFNQMYEKEGDDVWIYTYHKEARYRSLPSCDGQSSDSNSCDDDEHFEKRGSVCTCLRVANFWLHGMEALKLYVQPTYTLSAQIAPHLKSDFTTTAYDQAGEIIDKRWNSSESNDVLELAVPDLLHMANVSLDDVNEFATASFLSRDGDKYKDDKQVYRMTGLSIEVELRFSGVVQGSASVDRTFGNDPTRQRDTVDLELRARLKERTYESKGSSVVYINYSSPDCSNLAEEGKGVCTTPGEVIVDRFERGIRVNFVFSGEVSHFDIRAFFSALTNFIVWFGTVTTILTLVSMNGLGHRSKVYEGVRAADLSVARAHAHLGTQAVVAALSFDELSKLDDRGGRAEGIREVHIARFLANHGMDEDDAYQVAMAIVSEGDLDEDGVLNYEEWAKVLSDDAVDLKDVAEFVRKVGVKGVPGARRTKRSYDEGPMEKMVGPGETSTLAMHSHRGPGPASAREYAHYNWNEGGAEVRVTARGADGGKGPDGEGWYAHGGGDGFGGMVAGGRTERARFDPTHSAELGSASGPPSTAAEPRGAGPGMQPSRTPDVERV